jgi:hypothetical protein
MAAQAVAESLAPPAAVVLEFLGKAMQVDLAVMIRKVILGPVAAVAVVLRG